MSESVSILNGNTFVVSDAVGDIESSPTDPTGLFSYDTRFLSRWVLTVDGERLTSLSTDALQYFEARFFLVPGVGAGGSSVRAGMQTSASMEKSVPEREALKATIASMFAPACRKAPGLAM